MLARRIDLIFKYENKDISVDLAPYVESVEFTDNASGEADSFSLSLEDRGRRWQGDWFPEKGARIEAALLARNWREDNRDIEFPCGAMEIDEIELGGPPDKISIKALSVYCSGSIKEARSQGWENVTLKQVAEEIAGRHGLELLYDAEYNPNFDRKDQNEEADSAFLLNLCNDAGLCLKFSDGRLIIYDEAEYEQKEPAFVLEKGKADILSYGFKSKTSEVYKAARVSYRQGKKKATFTGGAEAPDADGTGRVLKINKKVASPAEADRLAQKKLREKNRGQNTASFTIAWRPDAAASSMVEIKGFGVFDGRYMLDKAQHTVRGSGGSTMGLELHRKLEGY
jgi:phage protein D